MNRESLLAELIRDEGLKLHAYQDSMGFWTIGIGRLIDKRRGGGITKEEAYYLAGHDIDDVEASLDHVLPWWSKMSERRQRALANMCFNLGMKGLLNFRKALDHLEAGRYAEAAEEFLDSLWSRQVGERAKRLAEMIREG